MKKTIFFAAAFLAVVACNKTEGNKNVLSTDTLTVSTDSTSFHTENKYRYVAEDGSNANVTFVNSDKENYIVVESNNSTLRGTQSEVWAKGAIYTNQDVEIKSQGDSITITQGDNIIELKRARGQ